MDLSITKLQWDSDFFGLNVGCVSLAEPREAFGLKPLLDGTSFDLVYVFAPVVSELSLARETLEDSGGIMYDVRTKFVKCIESSPCDECEFVTCATQISDELEALAYDSGVYSRFAKDPRLKPFFRAMYRLWLVKELANGKVFVWSDSAGCRGMVTVSVHDGKGRIGLVAVSKECRGKGIARKLMTAVDAWLWGQGVRECEVVTQGQNTAAQALYHSVGFTICDRKYVWHVWR